MVEVGRTLVIGGSFTSVNGTPRARLARIRATGEVDTSFNPGANGNFLALATEPLTNALLVAGSFTQMDGQSRVRLAKFTDRGVLTDFAPQASGNVYSLIPLVDGSSFIGGDFSSVNGTPRGRVARLDSFGNLDPNFNPDFNGQLFGLTASSDGKLWVAGGFSSAQGIAQRGLARISQPLPAQDSLMLNGRDAFWHRSCVAPELVRDPRLYISNDGLNYTFYDYMRRIEGGWVVRNLSVTAGQTLYLRARGVLAGGISNGSRSRIESTAQVLVMGDTIFRNGFD